MAKDIICTSLWILVKIVFAGLPSFLAWFLFPNLCYLFVLPLLVYSCCMSCLEGCMEKVVPFLEWAQVLLPGVPWGVHVWCNCCLILRDGACAFKNLPRGWKSKCFQTWSIASLFPTLPRIRQCSSLPCSVLHLESLWVTDTCLVLFLPLCGGGMSLLCLSFNRPDIWWCTLRSPFSGVWFCFRPRSLQSWTSTGRGC